MASLKANGRNTTTTADVELDTKLWAAAVALRSEIDAAGYKHVASCLIFLNYVADVFETNYTELAVQHASGTHQGHFDGYRIASISWVPKLANCSRLRSRARGAHNRQPRVRHVAAIERDDPSLNWAEHCIRHPVPQGAPPSRRAAQATIALKYATP